MLTYWQLSRPSRIGFIETWIKVQKFLWWKPIYINSWVTKIAAIPFRPWCLIVCPVCLLHYVCVIFCLCVCVCVHDDVIKWKHFPRNWPFVREIHRSPVNFPHKGQWRGALMFSLIYAWINDWVNNREAGDLRRQHGHYDVIVMLAHIFIADVLVTFKIR